MPGEQDYITSISVEGFKSIGEKLTLELKPLTILAGANNSGKSSIMQPLLLMKQTLECTYDPGELKLDGPNVTFTLKEQFRSRISSRVASDKWKVGLSIRDGSRPTAQPAHHIVYLQYCIPLG